jgi:hypothetical protein
VACDGERGAEMTRKVARSAPRTEPRFCGSEESTISRAAIDAAVLQRREEAAREGESASSETSTRSVGTSARACAEARACDAALTSAQAHIRKQGEMAPAVTGGGRARRKSAKQRAS